MPTGHLRSCGCSGSRWRKARLILCVNSDVSKHLRPPADRVVIHSAVGAHDEGPTAPREGKVFRILSVGRFVPLKGFDVALAAFARFHDGLAPAEREGVELVLVGAGPQEARLKALAARPGVSGRTRFVTWMERAELMDVYREATCFLFPSHEGAGMVVAEALSFGLPVVCFDNAGPGELMDGDSGIRVPYGRYEEAVAGFAAALQRLHSDRSLRARLSAGARRRFETWLDWNAKGEQLRKQIEGMAI